MTGGSVLIALSHSPASLRALDWTAGFAQRAGAVIVGVHVRHTHAITALSAGDAIGGGAMSELCAAQLRSYQELDAMFAEATRHRDLRATMELLAGRPIDAILDATRRHQTDLLVIGAPRSGRRRSLAAQLAGRAPCPITVVP